MKKICILIVVVFSLTTMVRAQQGSNTAVKKPSQLNQSEVPGAVMNAYHRENKDIPVIEVYIYYAYWQDSILSSDTATLSYSHEYPTETYGNSTKSDITPDYANANKPEYYELKYIKDKQTYKSVYSKDGTLMHTSRIIKDSELPKKIAVAIKNSKYKNWDVVGEKEKIHKKNPDIIVYRIKVNKGEDTHVLHYDQEGNTYRHKKPGL